MMQNKKFAVTGGIGSGKSTVCELLKARGFPVLSCDEISRGFWQEPEYRRELAALFPDCAENGEIIKEKLSDRVFSDRNALASLNAYTHGRIMGRLFALAKQFPVCFCEVPLLFESNYESLFDGILVVIRARKTRINGVIERSGLTREEVLSRMENQFDYDNELAGKSCVVIENDGSVSDLETALANALTRLGIS